MLVEFRVGNFLSFKEIVTFSMVAAAIKEETKDDNLFPVSPKLNLFTSAVIYGANAGGKSNLLKAMAFMKGFVLNSSEESQSREPISVKPFRLSTATLAQPSFFETTFIHEGIRYRYGFTADTVQVHQEWLFYAPKGIEARLFTRDQGKFELGSYFKEGKGLQEKTRSNALFLSVVAQFNGEITSKVLHWFSGLNTILRHDNPDALAHTVKKLNDPVYHKMIMEFLRSTDLGIMDVRVEEQIKTIHRRFDNEGRETAPVKFDLADESEGTKKIIALSGLLLDTLEKGHILAVDDLDSHLHPYCTRYIIKLFHSRPENPQNAQLIFTTHDTTLLSHEFLRRDQIWFTEKNEFGATTLYSLVEYKLESGVKVRNDASYGKDYLLGKYGAVPLVPGYD